MDTIKPFVRTEENLQRKLFEKYEVSPLSIIVDDEGNKIVNYPIIRPKQYLELIRLISELYPLTFSFERSVEELCCVLLESLIEYDDIQGIAKMEIQEIFGCK